MKTMETVETEVFPFELELDKNGVHYIHVDIFAESFLDAQLQLTQIIEEEIIPGKNLY